MSRDRLPMRGYWIALGVLVAITAIPMLAFMGMDWFMDLNGCQFALKSQPTCMFGETDWGPTLNSIAVWSLIIAALTMYVTVAGIIIWAIALAVHVVRWSAGTR